MNALNNVLHRATWTKRPGEDKMIQRNTLAQQVCDSERGEGRLTQMIPLVSQVWMVT